MTRAVRAQRIHILPKHSFPRKLSSHWLISCQILALVGLLFANRAAHAQDPTSAATLSVDVKVVTLPVTVRDLRGQIVRNLTKDDFLLEQDGHAQTIRYFAQEANLPLTLGLLVDTSMSQRNVLDQERTASESFLEQMLTAAKDQAFIIHFDREVELLQDLTSSRDKLRTALASLQTPSPDRNSRGGGESSPDSSPGGSHRMHGGGTLLYDAVFLASDELMKKQQGRKALIILSDGVDRGSKESLQSALEAAQRADTVVYSIYFADNHQEEGRGFGRPGGGWPGGGWPGGGGSGGGWPGGGGSGGGGRRGGGQRSPQEARPDGKKILERISKETGGRVYEVSRKETVDKVYASIAEELRTQYSLGYTPDKANDAAGYHKISLTEKNLTVQTRDGYYAER
jgi:VWFA-related protein